jgi:mannose-1-phosphate guanylyltransferase
VIVETDDAVLVIPRERAQDVRAVVDALIARGEVDKI